MRSLEESVLRKNWKRYIAYRERKTVGIMTGLKAIDDYLLGLGGLVLIQGGTGSCKSTLALQILLHNLRLGYPAMIIDKENGLGRLWDRLLCQANQVSTTDLAVAFATDKSAMKKYLKSIIDLPLHLYDEPVRSQDVVRERVTELLASTDKPTLLLVDSLQALDPADKDQRVSLEKWLVFLDSLKLTSDGRLTVLVTSEINRASYNENVGIDSGKGSNAVDFKAETLLDMRDTGANINLLVGKHRDGVKGGKFELEKVFCDPSSPLSFTYTLKASADAVLEGAQL